MTVNLNKGKCVLLIFLVAMSLRLTLGLLNREANDNHVDVVRLIIANGKLPEKNDCTSCYQPKLYYISCAAIIKALGVEEFYRQIKVMQLINVFISFFILLVFWRFIDSLTLATGKKLLTFSFFAFNPCLTGINVQGTNDSAAIFFGVLSVYFANMIFREMKFRRLIYLITALIAGAMCKASVAVLLPLISAGFAGKVIFGKMTSERKKAALYLMTLLIVFMTTVPFAGGYYSNYKKYNSLTLSCWEKDPPPLFFKKTWVVRSGLRSMFEGYFTFRYIDLLRQPYINNEWNNYPMHRTSLWSQLYGRTLFLHFDQWPPGWQSQSAFIVTVGRVLILLGIIPLALFLAGIFSGLGEILWKLLKSDSAYFAQPLNYIFLLISLAYLAASMFYCYSYRDYSAMKSIYIFPGMIAFIKMFADGYGLIISPKFSVAINYVLLLIVMFSLADIGFLVYQLY